MDIYDLPVVLDLAGIWRSNPPSIFCASRCPIGVSELEERVVDVATASSEL
jgi:hypothetical protein